MRCTLTGNAAGDSAVARSRRDHVPCVRSTLGATMRVRYRDQTRVEVVIMTGYFDTDPVAGANTVRPAVVWYGSPPRAGTATHNYDFDDLIELFTDTLQYDVSVMRAILRAARRRGHNDAADFVKVLIREIQSRE